jgi:hypothetical protein
MDQLRAGLQQTAVAAVSAPNSPPARAPMVAKGRAGLPLAAAPASARAPTTTTPTPGVSVVSSVRQSADPVPDSGYAPAALAR